MDLNSKLSHNIQRVEIRAFGCLLEDLLGLVDETDLKNSSYKELEKLQKSCCNSVVVNRPDFADVVLKLDDFTFS
jgi:hypothetical protein